MQSTSAQSFPSKGFLLISIYPAVDLNERAAVSQGFTKSTEMYLAFEQGKRKRLKASLAAIDLDTRVKLGEACPYIIKAIRVPKSRKGSELKKFCESFIELGFAQSITASDGADPTQGHLEQRSGRGHDLQDTESGSEVWRSKVSQIKLGAHEI